MISIFEKKHCSKCKIELLTKAAEYLTIHQVDLTSILDIGI